MSFFFPRGSAGVSGLTTGTIPQAASSSTLSDSVITQSSSMVGIGLGTVAPPTAFTVGDTSTSSPRGLMSWQANTGADGARLGFRKNRGTFASPTTIVTGDTIGRLVAWPYDGTGWLEMGSIAFESTGTIATNRTPTQIVFKTATDAAPSVLTTALTIGADQKATFAGQIIGTDGSSSAPSVRSSDADTGIAFVGNNVRIAVDGAYAASFAGGGLPLRLQTGGIGFTNSTDASGSVDVSLFRVGAGLFRVSDSGGSVYRDLGLRQLYVDQTITAGGTTGAQTINKAAGSVNFAASAASLVVTNSLVTASSIVICTVQTNDTTALIKNCVPTAGSFTITLNVAATAETKVAFVVINQ